MKWRKNKKKHAYSTNISIYNSVEKSKSLTEFTYSACLNILVDATSSPHPIPTNRHISAHTLRQLVNALNLPIIPALFAYLRITRSTHNIADHRIAAHGSFSSLRLAIPLHLPSRGCRLLLPNLIHSSQRYLAVRVLRIFPRTLRLISTPTTSLTPLFPAVYSSNLFTGKAFVRASYWAVSPAVTFTKKRIWES